MKSRPGAGRVAFGQPAPIRADDGRVLGAVLTLTDVSEQRRLQAEREAFVHTISHDLASR